MLEMRYLMPDLKLQLNFKTVGKLFYMESGELI